MKKIHYLILAVLTGYVSSCAVNEDTGDLETTWLFWFLIPIFLILLAFGQQADKKKEEAKQFRGETLEKVTEQMQVSAKVVGVDNHYQFIVDNVDKNIFFIEAGRKKISVPFNKIMSVEMVEDNTMISSKSLGRTIGGAIIGDLVAGGAGMIVGGMSGDSIMKKKVSKVEVVIKLRDLNNTALHIPCFDAERETSNIKKEIKADDSTYGSLYEKGLEDAIKITELVGIIIDQMDKANVTQVAETSQSSPSSIADEIKKLADMKAQGLISEEEFTALKAKLIN